MFWVVTIVVVGLAVLVRVVSRGQAGSERTLPLDLLSNPDPEPKVSSDVRPIVKAKLERNLRLTGFAPSYTYINRYDHGGITLDENTRCVAFSRWDGSDLTTEIFRSDQILSADLVVDGYGLSHADGMETFGRAFLGGLVAGGAGAVVAGASAPRMDRTMVNSMAIRVLVDDPGTPERTIPLWLPQPGERSGTEMKIVRVALMLDGHPEEWVQRLKVLSTVASERT